MREIQNEGNTEKENHTVKETEKEKETDKLSENKNKGLFNFKEKIFVTVR